MLMIKIYFDFQQGISSTNWIMITAIAAVFISFIALAFSIYNSYRGRKHDRLSVRPHLEIIYNVKDDGDTGLILCNNGVGPGIITKFEVYFDDKLVIAEPGKNPWKYFIKNNILPNARYVDCSILNQSWLSANISQKLFILDCSIKKGETAIEKRLRIQNLNSFFKIINRIKVKIDYESCYAGKIFRSEKFNTEFPNKN